MEKLVLNAVSRKETGKQVNNLRKQGLVPAVVYGQGQTTRNLTLKYVDLEKIYRQAGASSLIDLTIDNAESAKVLVSEIQHDPISGRYLHVDFNQIRMDKKLNTEIPLKFVGESFAVKSLGGILETSLQEVKVECLPQDLVHEIEVDLTPLKNLDDMIYIKDLKVPAGIEILNGPDEVVALAVEPQQEEITPTAPAEGAAAAAPAGEEKKEEPAGEKK
ncbi:MAG: 50S ribosomal protein L25 [bacterium]